ncbi:hypothetical protein OAF87_03530 [Akkermansiaceae bacterium]|nr:hypothetical protein [Akkermansiaceae bacterium]
MEFGNLSDKGQSQAVPFGRLLMFRPIGIEALEGPLCGEARNAGTLIPYGNDQLIGGRLHLKENGAAIGRKLHRIFNQVIEC